MIRHATKVFGLFGLNWEQFLHRYEEIVDHWNSFDILGTILMSTHLSKT